MNTIPTPMFWEALEMGAQTPLCRGTFIGANGAGCLITAAVRACGETVQTTLEVSAAVAKLWLWATTQVMPLHAGKLSTSRVGCVGFETWTHLAFWAHRSGLNGGSVVWVIRHYDETAASIPWIIAQIRDLEEYVTEDKQTYLDRVNRTNRSGSADSPAPVFSEVSA